MIRLGDSLGEIFWVAMLGVLGGTVGVIVGLLVGVGLQLLLYLLGIAPSVSTTHGTDWFRERVDHRPPQLHP